MKILSIETSCDETAISLIETEGSDKGNVKFNILGNIVLSQIELHREYGGVFPALAKREHAKNLPVILEKILKEAKSFDKNQIPTTHFPAYRAKQAGLKGGKKKELEELLSREAEMQEYLFKIFEDYEKPNIDLIAVTTGPGLEPALWVGINFAKALSLFWDISIIPINHMEGHIFASLVKENDKNKIEIKKVEFPALSLLISGGHTELILSKNWMNYETLGKTLDDAVGEAFDKVARILGLPYPGGPEISRIAKEGKFNDKISLPRPMLNSKDYNFSFSGLKTAVLYLVKKLKEENNNNPPNPPSKGGMTELSSKVKVESFSKAKQLDEQTKSDIAYEFENSVIEVLLKKTITAIQEFGVKTLIIGGGVSANKRIRNAFIKKLEEEFPELSLFLPEKGLSTDNSLMIGITGYFRYLEKKNNKNNESLEKDFRADGNLSL